jgi:hypothetical protein
MLDNGGGWVGGWVEGREGVLSVCAALLQGACVGLVQLVLHRYDPPASSTTVCCVFCLQRAAALMFQSAFRMRRARGAYVIQKKGL